MLMSYNNHIAEVEIASVIKKTQVLGPITFKNCSTPQEIQKSIKVLKPKTFKGFSTHFNKLKFKSNQSR